MQVATNRLLPAYAFHPYYLPIRRIFRLELNYTYGIYPVFTGNKRRTEHTLLVNMARLRLLRNNAIILRVHICWCTQESDKNNGERVGCHEDCHPWYYEFNIVES